MQTLIDHLAAFFAGIVEFRRSLTTAYPGRDDLNDAYEWGRELAHWVTFRKYED